MISRRFGRPELFQLQQELRGLSDVAESADLPAQSGQGPSFRAVHHGVHHMQHDRVGHRTSRDVGERAQHFGRRKQGE